MWPFLGRILPLLLLYLYRRQCLERDHYFGDTVLRAANCTSDYPHKFYVIQSHLHEDVTFLFLLTGEFLCNILFM